MKKLLCVVISFIMVLSMSVNVYATSINDQSQNVVYDDGETRLEVLEDRAGNMIFLQYCNGVLVQRNTINPRNPEVIQREFFDTHGDRLKVNDTINVNDYGVLRKGTANIQPRVVHTAGTINYRTVDETLDTVYRYYGLRCIYDESEAEPDVYTINGFVGRVLDLVTLLVGALSIPKVIVNEFITGVIEGAGISIVEGVIKEAFTDTVACDKTEYTWTLTDTTNPSHSRNAYGNKYKITSKASNSYGKFYYDGAVPQDWGKQSLAVSFHNTMFSYSVWEVVSWS